MFNFILLKQSLCQNLIATSLLILLFSCLGAKNSAAQNANHQVLTIVIHKMDGSLEKSIAYPPGTAYKVYRSSLEITPNEVENDPLVLTGVFEMLVYPSYAKNHPDQYSFKDQQVKIYQGATEFMTPEASEKMAIQQPEKVVKPKVNDHITVQQTITRSTLYPERYNLQAEFSNGISFFYEDGKYSANLDGKDLPVSGKYYIKSKLGIAKLSFNPRTTELWWVFEPKEK